MGTSKSGAYFAWLHEFACTFKCKFCTASFRAIHDITDHISKVHKRKFFYFSSSQSELECAWLFKCAKCLIEISTMSEMHEHYNSVHKIKELHCCEVCSSYFKDESMLAKHIEINHSGENLLRCPKCHANFKSKGGQKAHTDLHQKFKSFPISSEFAFEYGFNVDNLAQEENSETDILENNSDGKVSNLKEVSNMNLLRHAPKNCVKSELRKKNIASSKKAIHEGKKPFGCTSCPAKFRFMGQWKEHVITAHEESNKIDAPTNLKP